MNYWDYLTSLLREIKEVTEAKEVVLYLDSIAYKKFTQCYPAKGNLEAKTPKFPFEVGNNYIVLEKGIEVDCTSKRAS